MKTALAIAALATVAVAANATDEINDITKLVALDADASDRFGRSVAFSLTRTTVGAPNEGSDDRGAAYVFNTATGQQIYKFTPTAGLPGVFFGLSVASTGQNEIIGAPSFLASPGAVYVFSGSDGSLRFRLTASDATNGDRFGDSVAASGSRLIVGADGNDDDGPASGSAYIFDLQSGQQTQKLTASDAAAEDYFGRSVDISGTLAVVGAPFNDLGSVNVAGAVYVFDVTTGQQLRRITAPTPEQGAFFGLSVAILGDQVLIGAPFADEGATNAGAAYLFDAMTGALLHEFTSPNPTANGFFGYSVDINTTIVIGAPLEDNAAGDEAGAAYVFDRASGQPIYKLTPTDADASDEFGRSVTTLGRRTAVGAPMTDDAGSESGSAYVFDTTLCLADVNGDNTVDLADLNIILGAFGQSTTIGDTNFDGVVDLADLNRVLNEFGTDCP